ncbi:MAG: hypothetical protein V8T13_05660 [[Ruminococcus] lactaris]
MYRKKSASAGFPKMNRVQLSGNTPYISRSDDRKKMRKIRKNLTGQ